MFNGAAGYSDRKLELPCGQCIGCRLARSRQWALRCVHEAAMHERNCFVTLTYSPENLPADGSLDVTHWQKFAKRLRKRVGPFRYFHCGEYGEENARPHYHACLFGVDFAEDREAFKKRPYPVWSSRTLTESWGLGFCTVGRLTYESAAYVARYVMKKATGELAETRYAKVDPDTGEVVGQVKPEYVTMSRRPGIGASWFEKYRGDVFPADEVVHEGRRFRPPRFYEDRLGDDPLLEVLKRKRREAAAKHKDDLTHERLVVREKVAAVRLNGLQRSV